MPNPVKKISATKNIFCLGIVTSSAEKILVCAIGAPEKILGSEKILVCAIGAPEKNL